LDVSGVPPAAFSPAALAPALPGGPLDSIRISKAHVTRGITEVVGSVARGEINVSPTTVAILTLEMIADDQAAVQLAGIPFTVNSVQSGDIIFNSNNQRTPWKFLLRIGREAKQASISFTLDYSGLSVEKASEGVAFYKALAKGGKLRICGRHPLIGAHLQLATAAIPSGAYPIQEDRLMEILEHLAFIEKKTGASFLIPLDDILHEDANIIAATAQILKTGHAQYDAAPWISSSSIEQAEQALETFGSGSPASMAIHFEGQVVVIFGVHVMLGPVTLFCDRAYIDAKDVGEIRKQLQNAKADDRIKIRFTPFKDCKIEARYINWLPDDEAKAMRQLPMYQGSNVLGQEEEWTVPATDVDQAVALLESWYDEDADEQKASWQHLKSALDRDRLSDRKHFP
jgi:hypothetical protein